jgi:hypothetical protein
MARERTCGIVSRGGALFARVTYVDSTGKRKEITRKALDRADARRIIAELHARIDQHGGEAVLNDRSPLADIIEQYRQEKAQPAEIRDGKKISGLKSHYYPPDMEAGLVGRVAALITGRDEASKTFRRLVREDCAKTVARSRFDY